jgi:hypothetical protein
MLNRRSCGASLCKLLAEAHFAYTQIKPVGRVRECNENAARFR